MASSIPPEQVRKIVFFFAGIVLFVILLASLRALLPFLIVGGVLYFLFQRARATGSGSPIPSSFTNSFSSFTMPTLPSFRAKYIVVGVIVIALILVIWDGFVSVPAGQVGVVYDRGRGVLDEEFSEGLHLKIPFWQIVTIMDTRLQVYTMSVSDQERARYFSEPIEALTLDGQVVNIDATVQFRVEGSKASDIYRSIGLDYVEKVVKPGVRSVIRNAITGYDSTQLFTETSRAEASAKMERGLRDLYAASNVQLFGLLLRNVRFSDIYLRAIEEKQIAQQRIQKAEYEKQEASRVKERKIIEAQAEAEAIRLKGETLRANPSVIQFEFVQKMAPNIQWGVLPDSVVPLLDFKNLQKK